MDPQGTGAHNLQYRSQANPSHAAGSDPAQNAAALLLLVGDGTPENALLYAFAESGAAWPLYFARGEDEFREYLQGSGRFTDRQAYPSPSLLVLDLNATGFDGYQLLKWLGDNPSLRPPQVIGFTEANSPEETQRATELGAVACLARPRDHRDWVQFVHMLKRLGTQL